jgi:MSHA biogenesis protein MshL
MKKSALSLNQYPLNSHWHSPWAARATRSGIAAVAVLLLVACSTPLSKGGLTQTQASIKDEFSHAAAERKSQTEKAEKALMPPLQVEMPSTKTDAELRFDLSVVGAPANQVFMALVTGTHYSMLLPQDLGGTITLNLKDVTIKEALDTIRELYGYEYKVQGSRIFIQTNTLQSRVFQINYLAARRMGNSDLRVMSGSDGSSTSGASPGASSPAPVASAATSSTIDSPSSLGNTVRGMDTSRVSTSSDADFWRDLTTSLKSIVGTTDGRSMIINPLSGVVIVRAFPGDLRNVENYLKATQLMVERQVMIEAKIISVTLNNNYQAGINWSMFNSVSNGRSMMGVLGPGASLATSGSMVLDSTSTSTGLTVTPGKLGSAVSTANGNGLIGLAFQTANFSALLSFLETQGDVAVLSSPRIATLNNQKALLKVGTDDLFVVNATPGTAPTGVVNGIATGGTSATVTLQSFFSGIALDVTPQIGEDGNVTLHVHPSISTVNEVQKVINLGAIGGILQLPLPSSNITETDSIVRVQDGNVVAIGGLMRQIQSSNRAQLPGAGSGVLSNVLGQRSTGLVKTEMVILIKPTIIANDNDWQNDLQNIEARFDSLAQKPVAKK